MPIDNHIGISAQTQFLREHSDPSQQRYAFGYTITIINHGTQSARLLTRHWIITDANGHYRRTTPYSTWSKLSLLKRRYFIDACWQYAWYLYDGEQQWKLF